MKGMLWSPSGWKEPGKSQPVPLPLMLPLSRRGAGFHVHPPVLLQADPLRVVQPPSMCPGPLQSPGEPVLTRQQPVVPGWRLHATGLHHRPTGPVHSLCQWRLVRAPWRRAGGQDTWVRGRGWISSALAAAGAHLGPLGQPMSSCLQDRPVGLNCVVPAQTMWMQRVGGYLSLYRSKLVGGVQAGNINAPGAPFNPPPKPTGKRPEA